ncbi:hypothetical protein BDZ91DRAFT_779785 [Kalaharituber pfeilii]|nr:hypothetical protein BDZ91DRAFT_779785 [Kalaharituber pfeilii]
MSSATSDVSPPALIETRVDSTIRINASFSVLAAVAVILRMSFGVDDYTSILLTNLANNDFLQISSSLELLLCAFGVGITGIEGMGAASLVVNIFQCSPIAYAWDLSLNGSCLHRNAFYYAHSVLNILSDFAVYFMAIPIVHSVQLPRRQKTGLYVVLGLGAFVCVAGIVRMYYLHSVTHSVDSTLIAITARTEKLRAYFELIRNKRRTFPSSLTH